MHEIWVPSRFNIESFSKSGVKPSKLRLIPEAVDTDFFNPSRAAAKLEASSAGDGELRPRPYQLELMPEERRAFKFLSIFKWEYRKGWDILLKVRSFS